MSRRETKKWESDWYGKLNCFWRKTPIRGRMLKSGQGKLLLRFVASIKCSWRVESTSNNIYLGITLFFQPEKILTLWRDKSNHYEESISRSLVLRNSPRKELYDKRTSEFLQNLSWLFYIIVEIVLLNVYFPLLVDGVSQFQDDRWWASPQMLFPSNLCNVPKYFAVRIPMLGAPTPYQKMACMVARSSE